MKNNKGHTACIAFGINYAIQNEKFDNQYMDGDGEDRPEEIIMLINKNNNAENKSVVAKELSVLKEYILEHFIKFIN